MREFLKRNSPPGIDLKQLWYVFLFGNLCSILISFAGFLSNYIQARRQLFCDNYGHPVLITDATIKPFYGLLDDFFLLFYIVAFVLLGFIIYYYSYFRQGSMSIYLMKRLPDKRDIHRRALTIPCLAGLATIVVAITTVALYYVIYLLATPKACLP